MNLDRHNYEEYFILYMDNELNAAERKQVEAFVSLHPDLKEELDLLMQFKLEPDESIVFDGKDELLKNSNPSVVTNFNYKGWLMLYLDDELTAADKKCVEQFLSKSPEAQKEWSLLEKTKLQPESLVFADKSSLYRTEKIKRIPVRWFRVAAAAVLLIGIGLTTVILVNKKPATEETFVNTTPGSKKIDPPVINPAPKQEVVADLTDENSKPEEQKVAANAKQYNIAENKKPDLILPVKNEERVVKKENEIPNNNLPKPIENAYVDPNKTNDAVAVTNPANGLQSTDPLTVSNVTNQSGNPSIIQVHNPETEGAELDQTDGKKTRLRGLFRKVARTFEKRTNIASADDENKLLVAGLAFKLK